MWWKLKIASGNARAIFIEQAIAQVAALGRVNHAINSVIYRTSIVYDPGAEKS